MGSEPPRVRVGVADAAVSDDDTLLVTSGLGSCVGVAIYDENGTGGLLHAMLPAAPADVDNPSKYVDSGISAMVAELESGRARRNRLAAKLTGGSSMLDLGEVPIGDKNVSAARRHLEEMDIELVAEETGGGSGRSVSFHPGSGRLTIKRVNAAELTL